MMVEAWNKGVCSPYEFRKCLREDLLFINDINQVFKEKSKKKQEDEKHQMEVADVLHRMRNG